MAHLEPGRTHAVGSQSIKSPKPGKEASSANPFVVSRRLALATCIGAH